MIAETHMCIHTLPLYVYMTNIFYHHIYIYGTYDCRDSCSIHTLPLYVYMTHIFYHYIRHILW